MRKKITFSLLTILGCLSLTSQSFSFNPYNTKNIILKESKEADLLISNHHKIVKSYLTVLQKNEPVLIEQISLKNKYSKKVACKSQNTIDVFIFKIAGESNAPNYLMKDYYINFQNLYNLKYLKL